MDTPQPQSNRRLTPDIILTELKAMIARELDVRIPEEKIVTNVPLLEGGLMLDSMVLFELITLIEERYGVAFPADDLNSEVFASLEILAQNIFALAQGGGLTRKAEQ